MIKLTFDDGSSVDVPRDVQEMDTVTVTDRSGKKIKTSWGSVVAHTNGEALDLLEQNRPKSWMDNLNQQMGK